MVNFKVNYHFSRFHRGSNIFQGGGGGPTFSRGGGSGPPVPPSGSPLAKFQGKGRWMLEVYKHYFTSYKYPSAL